MNYKKNIDKLYRSIQINWTHNTVRVAQGGAVFSGASNDIKLVNWNKLEGLSSVPNGLMATAFKYQTQHNTFSHIRLILYLVISFTSAIFLKIELC